MQPSIDALSLDQTVQGCRASTGLSRWFSVAILTLLGMVGAILLWRWLAGALRQPLSAEALAILSILLAGTVLIARWAWHKEDSRSAAKRFDRFMAWCPVVLILPIAVAVHLPGTSIVGMVCFWSILVLEESAWRLWRSRRRKVESVPSPKINATQLAHEIESWAGEDALLTEPTPETLDSDFVSEIEPEETDSTVWTVPNNQVTQQFVRSHSAEGGDVFSGWLRLAIPPGGRTTNVHVAFCPPFAHAPSVDVHQVDGPTGRVKMMQSLAYGARFDFKLKRSSEESTTVLLRFVARLADE